MTKNLETFIDVIFDGDSILFAGAGFAEGATSNAGKSPLLLNTLKEELFKAVGLDNSGTIGWAVDKYIEQFSEPSLINYLRQQYIIKEYKEEHAIIANQLWKGIYTTNYDNLIETIFSDKKRNVRSTTSSSKPSSFSSKRDLVVHLNGFIESLDDGNDIPSDFLLREIDYVTSEFINSNWYTHFKGDIITSDAIFFVGFSMRSDLDISRIVYTAIAESSRDKIIFIVHENEPDSSVAYLSEFGHVFKIGAIGFSKLIAKRKVEYIPKQNPDLKLFSFKEYKPTSQAAKITTDEVFDLLFYGKFLTTHIESSLTSPLKYRYYVKRSQLSEMVELIENGNKNIVIASDLGNGKSLLIEGLKYLLHTKGYKVFHFSHYYDSFPKEVLEIYERHPGCVLVIENYNHNLKAFDFLQTRRSPKSVIITSERLAIHETSYHKIEKYFGTNYLTYEIDRLTEPEIKELVEILNIYGLWGDYANLLETEKISFIKNVCNSNIRLLLLKLLESESILEKFKQVIAEVTEQKNYFEAIVLMLSANLFNIVLEVDQLIAILNDEKFRKPSFMHNPAIRELVDVTSGTIKVKSAILSEMLLSKSSNAYSIVKAILRICKQLDKWTEDPTYFSLYREYISYSNIFQLTKYDNENHISAIELYFEELRNLNFCKENPHYWLQYAILNIEKGNLPLAKTQFETAYSYAKRKTRFDTYQLDNQYARYLLLNQINNGTEKTCMLAFREAHSILSNNLSPNKLRYYPYKVAQNYVTLYDRFFEKLKKEEKSNFVRLLKEMNFNIEKYLTNVNDQRVKVYIVRIKSQIETILNKHPN